MCRSKWIDETKNRNFSKRSLASTLGAKMEAAKLFVHSFDAAKADRDPSDKTGASLAFPNKQAMTLLTFELSTL